jgi:glycosyltransferase involved in cell wall biosynthesis
LHYVSVIIPTYNESNNFCLPLILEKYSTLGDKIELIFVDGGSTDSTLELISKFPQFRILKTHAQTRAERLNIGIAAASCDKVVLHHPRSLLSPEGLISLITTNDSPSGWGAFTHKFDDDHPLLRFTSWYSNYIRGDIFKIFYLDHCLYFKKSLFSSNEFELVPIVPIFEDTLLCKKLNHFGKPKRLEFISTTSSIRFKKNGVVLQSIMNQVMKLGFYFNVPYSLMNKIYERGLSLNGKS